jgi:hypothetical protein
MHRLRDLELPYDDTRDTAWEAGVDELPWTRRHDDTRSKQGPCPRCGHSIIFVEEAPGGDGRTADGQGKFEECNCGVIHPGTPEGRIGCGANGLISRAGSALSAGSSSTST